MDYEKMSNPDKYNRFGHIRWAKAPTKELALNAGIARSLSITDAERNNFGPFTRLHFENHNTTVTIQLDIDGCPLGDNTISNSRRNIFILPGTAIDILPDEDNVQFSMIAIKNTHGATNTSNDELVWDIANF